MSASLMKRIFKRSSRSPPSGPPSVAATIAATTPASASPATSAPVTRLEAAHTNVLQASQTLATTLVEYSRSSDPEAARLHFGTENPLAKTPGSPPTPEQVNDLICSFLTARLGQEPSLASRVGLFMSKLYPLASIALGLGAAAAEAAAFVPVKGAMNVISALISIAEAEKDRGEDFLKQLNRITFQALRVAEITKKGHDVGELLREKCLDLTSTILLFFNNALLYFRHSYFTNVRKTLTLGPKLYLDAKENLGAAIQEYDQALLIEITVKIIEHYPFGSGANPQETRSWGEMHNWLLSSYQHAENQLRINIGYRSPGTLQYFLQIPEFISFRVGATDPGAEVRDPEKRTLWVYGPPGIGKSIISGYVVQTLKAQHPDAIVLYFFCKAGHDMLDQPVSIVRTLAGQLAQSDKGTRTLFDALMGQGINPSEERSSVGWLFEVLLRDAVNNLEKEKTVFVVLDGLDECMSASDSDGVETLLKGLRALERVHTFITSRSTPELLRALHSARRRPLTFEDSKSDIEAYIAGRVAETPTLQQGFRYILAQLKDPYDNPLWSTPQAYLANRAQGNFMWVRIMLGLVQDTQSAKEFQRLLESIPAEITGVYAKILDRLDRQGKLKIAMATLDCVLFCFRQLGISSLGELVGFALDEKVLDLKGSIEGSYGEFLVLTPGNEEAGVAIVHETFREYICDEAASGKMFVSEWMAHGRIVLGLLRCLKTYARGEERPKALLDYATERWTQHFNAFLKGYEKQLGGGVKMDETREVATNPTGNINEIFKESTEALYAFFANPPVLQFWMRQLAFLKDEIWLGSGDCNRILIRLHDGVLGLLNSQALSNILDTLSCDLKSWRATCTAPSSLYLADTLSRNFISVWLNTNWASKHRALGAVAHAFTFRRAMQLIEPHERVDPETWRKENIGNPRSVFGNVTLEEASRPGATWLFTGNIWLQLKFTRAQLEELTGCAEGEVNQSIYGVQAGNFAFAEAAIKDAGCVKSFKRAIEEFPERSDLHEGLGWYYEIVADDKENAVLAYAEAMKHDIAKPPKCARQYYCLSAELQQEKGEYDNAVATLVKGAEISGGKDTYVYWNRAKDVLEKKQRGGDWEGIKALYRRAIASDPRNSKTYWRALAKAHRETLDWEGEMNVLLEASAKDKEGQKDYGKELRSLARDLLDEDLWNHAQTVLKAGIQAHPEQAGLYKEVLGQLFLATRQWSDAISILESELLDDTSHRIKSYIYSDLCKAYLGAGAVDKLIEAKRLAEGSRYDPNEPSFDIARAYIAIGDYRNALKSLRGYMAWKARRAGDDDMREWEERKPDLAAERKMEVYTTLALCHERLGNEEEASTAFQIAVDAYAPFATKEIEKARARRSGRNEMIHRCDARSLRDYAEVCEKVGTLREAKEAYGYASYIFERTTFVGDENDEVYGSEHEEVVEALQRVTVATDEAAATGAPVRTTMPDIMDRVGSIRLERKIAFTVRVNAYSEHGWEPPRYRGELSKKLLGPEVC